MTTETQQTQTPAVNGSTHYVTGDFDKIPTAGALVFWRLSGDVAHAALVKAFEDGGLPKELLPAEPSPATVLRRAMQELREPTLLVRPWKPAGGDQHGWALVREQRGTEDLEHATEYIITLGADNEVQVRQGPSAKGTAPGAPDKIRAAYKAGLGVLTTNDMSSWYIGQARALKSVALRDTGGVYFLPRSGLAVWRMVTQAVAAATAHATFEIPALKTDEAAAAILDSVRREAESVIADVDAAFEDAKDDNGPEGMGKRAAGTQLREVEAMKEKLASYEALLDRSAADLKEKLEGLRGRLVAIRMGDAAAQEGAAS